MQTRRLGNSNLELSAVGLGCMGMTFSYGTRSSRCGRAAAMGRFGIAAVALALLLVGIHDAWDTVTHLVVLDTEGR